MHPSPPPATPTEFISTLKSCWDRDPNERPPMKKIYNKLNEIWNSNQPNKSETKTEKETETETKTNLEVEKEEEVEVEPKQE